MYILVKSGVNGPETFTAVSQESMVTHILLLGAAFDYVSRGFKSSKLSRFRKYAQLLHYNFVDSTLIGEIEPSRLRDINGNIFDLRHLFNGYFYLECHLKNIEDGIHITKSTHKITKKYNGLGLLGMAVRFVNGYLNTNIATRYQKVAYFYDQRGLLYSITPKGIFEGEKMILDFATFQIINTIPKRKRK